MNTACAMLPAVSWVKKVGKGMKLHIFDRENMAAYSLNFAAKAFS